MTKTRAQTDIGDLKRARSVRMETDRNASMSERLARVHNLSKQMSAIKSANSTPNLLARAASREMEQAAGREQDRADLANLPET